MVPTNKKGWGHGVPVILGTAKYDLTYPPPYQPNPSPRLEKKIVSALLSVGNIYQHTVPNNLLCVAMRGSYVAQRRPFVGLRGPLMT